MPVEPMPSGPVAFPRFHVAVASTREGLPREGPGVLQPGCCEVRRGFAEDANEMLCELSLPARVVEQRVLPAFSGCVVVNGAFGSPVCWVLLCSHARCSCLLARLTAFHAVRLAGSLWARRCAALRMACNCGLSLKRSKPPLGVVGGRLAMLARKSSALDRGFAARNSCELWTRGCGTAWWGGPMVRRCLVAALVDSPL